MNRIPIDGHGRLYVSDIDSVTAQELPRGTDRAISTCQDTVTENIADDVSYEHYPLADDEHSEAKWGGSCDYDVFDEAAASIYASLRVGETIVVHCHKGRNRSVATSAAALAALEETTFRDAVERIQEHRKIADPNSLMQSHARSFIEENT